MRRPKYTTTKLTTGAGSSTVTASTQSTFTMMATEKIRVKTVSVEYITPGPSAMRTALRSLVARAMRSPTR